jgi:hypothetical protein
MMVLALLYYRYDNRTIKHSSLVAKESSSSLSSSSRYAGIDSLWAHWRRHWKKNKCATRRSVDSTFFGVDGVRHRSSFRGGTQHDARKIFGSVPNRTWYNYTRHHHRPEDHHRLYWSSPPVLLCCTRVLAINDRPAQDRHITVNSPPSPSLAPLLLLSLAALNTRSRNHR